MHKKLLERLNVLDEAAESIRAKAESNGAKNLDALVLAETLLFVDKAAERLTKLNGELQATLFDGEGKETA